jgi:hypothetical protein
VLIDDQPSEGGHDRRQWDNVCHERVTIAGSHVWFGSVGPALLSGHRFNLESAPLNGSEQGEPEQHQTGIAFESFAAAMTEVVW